MTKKTTATGAFFFGIVIIVLFTLLTAIGLIEQKKVRTLAGSETVTPVSPAPSDAIGSKARERIAENYGKIPMAFEANEGQTDAEVKFLSRGRGYSLFLTSTESVLVLRKSVPIKPLRQLSAPPLNSSSPFAELDSGERAGVHMKLLGSNPSTRVEDLEELPGKTNYFIGNDPKKWHTNVHTYAKLRYPNIYPGIELIYHGNQRILEYDFVVAPGGDPNSIALGFQGTNRLEVDAEGDLLLNTALGVIRQRKPNVYQEVAGVRREISGGYVLKGKHQVGFHVAAYDASEPLVIDPVLSYSTLLGGSSPDEGSEAITVDAAGNAYVTGHTSSTNFPTTVGAFQTANGGNSDIFVTKLNPTGSELVYSTYLGGNGNDIGQGIAVDSLGSTYVTGSTNSFDFPTVAAFQPIFAGGFNGDAFVTKVNAAGSALVYSSYLGGSDDDVGIDIAVDVFPNPTPNAYLTGRTVSSDFPTTAGAFQATGGSAFVAKIADDTLPPTPTPTPTPTPGVGPPTNKDQCKNGGWQMFNVPRAFKNQGDCIQFVNTGK